MATYIDLSSNEEQALTLVQLLNQAKNKGKDPESAVSSESFSKLIGEARFGDLWIKLLEDSAVLFSEVPDKDVEAFFYATSSLLKRSGAENVSAGVPKIIAAVTSSEEKSLLRLRILGTIYNILDSNPTARFEIFHAVLIYAGTTKHPEVVIPHFKDLDTRITEWKIDENQTRELFKRISVLYRQNGKYLEAHRWTVKYLLTLHGVSDEVKTEAVNAALDAIKSTELYQFEGLLEVPAIKQLEKDTKYSKLYQLLNIFVGESLDSFKTFVAANREYIQQLDLNEEQSTHKMRLLSIASLAAANHELTYSQIAKALQLDESDVEVWIISAISDGILEAKMDQIKKIVRVTRSLQRIFTQTQWKHLGENLTTWKKNVQILLTTLQDCKHQTQQKAIELAQGDVTQI